MGQLSFPLFQRAARAGVLEGKSALIVAPTATGKSYIGRQALYRAVRREPGRLHLYLVPFRALATEMYETMRDEVGESVVGLRVATGDYTDPVNPERTDLLIATYERFAGLLESRPFQLGSIVADEFHLIDDATRGPTVEGLFARILARHRPTSMIGLSAVIANAPDIASWLGVLLIQGRPEDRQVALDLDCTFVASRDAALVEAVAQVLKTGEQALVFCRSRAAAEKVARKLVELCKEALQAERRERLRELAERIVEEVEDTEKLGELLVDGVAYHHAGLSRRARQAVEEAFRGRTVAVIACTPTLAAGVNLPAGLVVVRDVYRTEVVRGRHLPVVLPSGDLLNMLGRAGRPHLTERGRGLVLIEKRFQEDPRVKDITDAVEAGRGSPITSKLPESFDALLRFVLSAVVDRGEVTRTDLVEVFQRTLWYHEEPQEIGFDKPFKEDMMEDLPAYARAKKLALLDAHVAPDGVEGTVKSGKKRYAVALRIGRWECACHAAHFRPWEVCKHASFAIHELLFGEGVDREIHARAVYACLHLFKQTLDLGTKLSQALDVLLEWDLLERVPGGAYRATPVGRVASGSRFDILLVRQAADRVRAAPDELHYEEAALWPVDDYFGDQEERDRWRAAVEPWIRGEDDDAITLPTRFRGDFENGMEDLARVAALYADLARELGRKDLPEVFDKARGVLRYGVPPAAVPLAALRFPGLGRRRCIRLLENYGIRNVEDLAAVAPDSLRLPGIGKRKSEEWVVRARQIIERRGEAAPAPRPGDPVIDALLSEFQVEPLSLFPAAV